MIIGTVLHQKSPFNSTNKPQLALVIDEFDLGGSMGAQIILPNGSVVSVSQVDFNQRFEVVGFSPQFGDYAYRSSDLVELDFVNGVFDPVFRKEEFNYFETAAC